MAFGKPAVDVGDNMLSVMYCFREYIYSFMLCVQKYTCTVTLLVDVYKEAKACLYYKNLLVVVNWFSYYEIPKKHRETFVYTAKGTLLQ